MTGKLSLAPTLLKGRFSSEKYFRNFWGVKQLENSIEYFYKTEQKRWEIVALESTLRMLRVRLCVFAAEKDLINPAAAKIGRQARWREPSLCTRTPRRSCTSPRGLASEPRLGGAPPHSGPTLTRKPLPCGRSARRRGSGGRAVASKWPRR